MKCFIILITLNVPLMLMSQEWTVPADRQGKLSFFKFSDSTRNAGMNVYSTNCMSCHGTPGKGNFQRLTPPPGDPATDKLQHNKDGELFYKVSEGHGQMPSFKNSLSANDIWNVVSFIRSFNKTYAQSVAPTITAGAYAGAVLIINLKTNAAGDSILFAVHALKNNHSIAVANAGIKLFVHRTFGQMALGEELVTNGQGLAATPLPLIPGDTAGNVMVTARLTDEEKFGAAGKDTILQTGIKVIPQSLTAKRAMWNVVNKAPVWLLLTYFTGLFTILGFILYILLKIRDIYIAGKYIEQQKIKNDA
jgi:mono/diheme cytochrome c family protein